MAYTYTLRVQEILTHEVVVEADNYEDAIDQAEKVIDQLSFSVDDSTAPSNYDWERTEGLIYNSIEVVESDDPEQEN